MDERYERGLKRRREVLGKEHVDRSLASATPFTRDMQELVTMHAWGDIWTRPGLEEPTRRLLTIVMLVALNREHELRLHLRAARDAGVPAEVIKEALLQAAVYLGVPAGMAAFRVADEVFSATQ